ncbi:WD40/YVTN/BNR-like repeat-containing protein [Flavobacterium sp.]|uniref:WD40/YVTN/BNR-like repeat-containing protein n=1 Tax=Flavobacterium sp. TaxID=239 RepID=UPI0039E6A65A
MRHMFSGLLLFLFTSNSLLQAQTIQLDTLLRDKISIRAIAIDQGKIWYAGDKGRFGSIHLKDRSKNEHHITKDTFDIEFRSLAQTHSDVLVANVGNPALLYKISKEDARCQLVYQEKHEKVFYDSMQFWNDREGIAIGDPTENCFSVLLTKDGGQTWHKQSCQNLPALSEGEAAFAASNTNIVVKGSKTWIVSGGVKSRVFFSTDKGKTWTVAETPIVQGKAMTGIFTADFYDERNGIIAGGDYEIQDQNFSNKAITNDGGKTWKPIAENQGFGYASCIQYVPKSKGQELMCVGGTGIWYSSDGAQTWKKLSDAKDLYTLRFADEHTAIAAGRGKIVRIKIQK